MINFLRSMFKWQKLEYIGTFYDYKTVYCSYDYIFTYVDLD